MLHELGHIVDFVLVEDGLLNRLDQASHGSAPRPPGAVRETFASRRCAAACRSPGRSGIPSPASLEDWGPPLGRLAIELDLKR